MKSRTQITAIALGCVAAFGAAAQTTTPADTQIQVAAAAAAPSSPIGLANSRIGAETRVEQGQLRSALAGLSVVAIVGESAILRAERPIAGLPRELTVRTGRTFAVLGVPVTPAVNGNTVEFTTAVSNTPISVARLGETGAEVVEEVITTAPEQEWVIQSGQTIRNSVQSWADRAGWQLVWSLDEREDFEFLAGNRFTGDFRAAIYGLFNSLPLEVKVRAELRPDNFPPMVLISRDEGIR